MMDERGHDVVVEGTQACGIVCACSGEWAMGI